MNNPYVGDAVALAQYRQARANWVASGRRGPPPVPPRMGPAAGNPQARFSGWALVGTMVAGVAVGAGAYHLLKKDGPELNPRTKNP